MNSNNGGRAEGVGRHDPGGAEAGIVDLRAVAQELYAAGICAVPVSEDGSKTPDLRSWTPYKTALSTPEEHDSWFDPARRSGPRSGIGVVYGAVSGDLELIEFEGRALKDGLLEKATDIFEASGLGDVWAAITTGWVDESPSGGRHFRIRVEGCPVKGNTKLAGRPARDDELTDEERARLRKHPNAKIVRVEVETRGEGGFGIIAPSNGSVHPSGKPYVRLEGGPSTVPVLDADLYDAVHTILKMLDQVPKSDSAKTAPRDVRPLAGGQLRPGEDYEARTDWSDILAPLGWTFVFQHGPTRYWRRPGKSQGLSATTGHASDRDRLFVFTTSTEFLSETPYTKFGAYGHIHHGGDFKAASLALRNQGFGDKPPHRGLASVTTLPTPTRPSPTRTDGANALDYEDPEEVWSAGTPSRPAVDITNEAVGVDALIAVMANGALPGLYKRSGGPCWVSEDSLGNPIVRQLNTDNLRAYLGDHVLTYTVSKDEETGGTKEIRALVMPRTCSTILGRKDWPLPPLRGMVTSPVVRPDGSLLTSPGYDVETGLYLHPRVPVRPLRTELSQESVANAKKIILGQMLADFPWTAPSDRAQYLGALLAPIIRPYVPGPTPPVIITATSMGSGKTLLKDIFRYCYGVGDMPWPENEAELRKAITAQLYGGGEPVVAMDNLPNGFTVKSAIFSDLVTKDVWGDRVLGSTEKISMQNDRLWMLIGNNLRTGGDNGRRALWVRIDPDCPNPDQRDDYTVGDLRPWLKKNASTVVAALVTMVRSWLAAGAKPVRFRMGDYSEWASVVGGILAHLEIEGWLADRDIAATMDAETEEWTILLEVWQLKFPDRGITTGEAIGALREYIPRQKGDELPSAKQLGHWLKARQGRYFGTRKLIQAPDAHLKQNVWRVAVHGGSAQLEIK